uniref:NADH-ubiquinone oxidoreductase chain 4 n=1 Tax=Enchytraeus albidus TaxID=6390 RepID=A0A286KAV4_9ANNE|nr:NADH dehydrogenase subunit 4 [Enchytraeus albidus]
MLKLLLPLISMLPVLYYFKLSWWIITGSMLIASFMAIPLFYSSYTVSISTLSMSDLMSSSLLILSLLIGALMMVASSKIYLEKQNALMFSFMNLMLLIILILCFSTKSMMSFYIWFEASLIPTMFIIMMWGYQPERMQASMYLMMYTVVASLPMLVMLCTMMYTSGHSSMAMPTNWVSPNYMVNSNYAWLLLNMGFLVKLPMFSVHLWSPKAHVEAPIAGSMVLAAILLKLGVYGLLRMISMYSKLNNYIMSSALMSLSLCGAIITSMICLRQSDIKSLIAYSSVGHMGLMLASILTNTNWAMWGGLMIMVAHGLCSSALFILANMTYEITHTRSMFLTKGIMTALPTLSMWWFLFTAWNMAAPPSINLLSEIMLMTSILCASSITAILVMVISFLAAAYSLNMYATTQHGHLPSFSNPLHSMKIKDMLLLLIHLIPIIMLISKPELISLWN